MPDPKKEVTFADGLTVVTADFLNLLQEVIAGLAHNVEIDSTGTSIRVVAGADADAATIYIDGEFRFVVANVTLDMAGKGAGAYSIYATADTADDAWALEVAVGAPVATKYRKIGEVDWDGAAITAVRTTVGKLRTHTHADAATGGAIFDAATPSPSQAGAAGAAGSVTVAARRDHTHALAASTTPVAITAASGAVGSSAEVARADHRHGYTNPTAGAPLPVAVTAGAGAAGVSDVAAKADHSHPFTNPSMVVHAHTGAGEGGTLFDVVVPAAVSVGGSGSSGAQNLAARRDHTHAVAAATMPTAIASGAGAVGVAAEVARADHSHAYTNPTAGATLPAVVAGASAVGTSDAAARADHVHGYSPPPGSLVDHAHTAPGDGGLIFGSTAPAAVTAGGSGAAGAATIAARRDHTHTLAASTAPTSITATTPAVGVSAEVARADHRHGYTNPTAGAPDATTITPGVSAPGTSDIAAKADHVHGYTAASVTLPVHGHTAAGDGGALFDATTPAVVTAGGSGAAGVAATVARRDHSHGLAANTTPTVISVASSSVGSSAEVARADHRHGYTAPADQFPSGTRMFFDNDAAPLGWSRVVTVDDRFLRVVSGARAPEGGTWTQPTHLHTTPAHSHSHTHGAHSHTNPNVASAANHAHTNPATGDSGGHDHSIPDSDTAGGHSHGMSADSGVAGGHTHTNPDTSSVTDHSHFGNESGTETVGAQRTTASAYGLWSKAELSVAANATHSHTSPVHGHGAAGSHSHGDNFAVDSAGTLDVSGTSSTAYGPDYHSHASGTYVAASHGHSISGGVYTAADHSHGSVSAVVDSADAGHTHTPPFPYRHTHLGAVTQGSGAHSHTVGSTGSTADHAHTLPATAAVAAHKHTFTGLKVGAVLAHSHTQADTGSAGAHDHSQGSTGSSTPTADATTAAPSTDASATVNTWRPAYRDVILCQKD